MPESGDAAGRPSARSQRTRSAVVDALQELIVAGHVNPGARAIAERAGVSTRSVFAHFSSLEDLHQAVAEQVTVKVIGMLTPIDPAGPLGARIVDLCTQRGRVNEELAPFRRAAAAREQGSAPLAAARDHRLRAARDQVERVFAAELRAVDGDRARRLSAAIDVATSGEAWDLLRAAHGLAPDEARTATVEALNRLLAPVARAAPAGPADAGAAAPPPDTTAIEAARATLARARDRIGRLVAAIEAGAPADLLAPRLHELRAEAGAAECELAALGASP